MSGPFFGVDRTVVPRRFVDPVKTPPAPMPKVGDRIEARVSELYEVIAVDGETMTVRRVS